MGGWVGEWLGGWVNGMGGVCVVWCRVCRQDLVWRLVDCDARLLFPSEQEVVHKRSRRVQVVTPLVCLSVAFVSSQGTTCAQPQGIGCCGWQVGRQVANSFLGRRG